MGILHCEVYDYVIFIDETIDASLLELFCTKRTKRISRTDGFLLYGKWELTFSKTSEKLYPNMKNKIQLSRARPNFYMITDNPNVSFKFVDCSFYTRCIAPKDDCHHKRIDMPA